MNTTPHWLNSSFASKRVKCSFSDFNLLEKYVFIPEPLSSLFPLTLQWIFLVKVYLLFTNNFFLASERMAALYQRGNVLLRGITAFIPISSFKIQIQKCRIAFPGGCLTVQQGCKWRATFPNCPEHPGHASCSSIFCSDVQITALQKPWCFNTSSSPVGKANCWASAAEINKKVHKRHSSLCW